MRLKISLFGPFQVFVGDEPVSGFASDKVRALLAFLACEAEQPYRREYLAGLLWPESSESAARASLRNALANLRRVIRDRDADPSFLTTTRQSVQFNCTAVVAVDVRTFFTLTGQSSRTSIDVDDAMQAVALARGPFLEGFSLADSPAFEEWALLQREHLQRLLLQTLDRLTDANEAAPANALPYAQCAVDLEPWVEARQRRLIALLARAGRASEALAQYQRLERVLALELGVAPDADSVAIAARIRAELGLPSPHALAHHRLPALLTPLIGRQHEIAQLEQLLVQPDIRLVTIAGPGGIGKSRLALAIADHLAPTYEHGICFVEMAALENPDPLPSTIIHALGLTLAANLPPEQQLINYLRNRRVLLVLDNFEHLLAAAPMIVKLLEAAPNVTALATSRARLNVRGEHLYPLFGLPLPKADDDEADHESTDSVRLFVYQARQQRSDFQLSRDNLPAVNRICCLVQGMPLGILLAAGWMDMLSSDEIADRIADSLDFLESDLQDLPARQRSLRAVFASTWAMLTENEREIYPRLSIFRGGWTVAAGEAVAGLSVRDLKWLLDKSLVQRIGPDRFTIHELLRQYAAEMLADRLTDEAATTGRHARFFISLLADKASMLNGPNHLSVLTMIQAERENLRIAWQWSAAESKLELLSKGVDGLSLFYQVRGYTADGILACQLAIDGCASLWDDRVRGGEALALTARLLVWQGLFHRERGEDTALHVWERAEDVIRREEVRRLDTRRIQADLAHYRGVTALRLSDFEDAHKLCASAETLYRELNEQWALGQLLINRATIYWHQNHYDQCRDLCTEALDILQEIGDDTGIARALMTVGLAANSQGRFREADRYLRQCAGLAKETSGNRISVATARNMLGWNMMYMGNFGQAATLSLDSATIADELGNRYWASLYRWAGGAALLHEGDYGHAEEVMNTGLALAQEADIVRNEAALQMLLGAVAMVNDDAEHAQRWAQAGVDAYSTIEHVDELARALAVLCTTLLIQARVEEARPLLFESIRYCERTGVVLSMIPVLPAAILYLASVGEHTTALTYYSVAIQQPMLARSRWYADVYWQRLDELTATISATQRAAAKAQAHGLSLPQVISALLHQDCFSMY